jgi:hypothetical protein
VPEWQVLREKLRGHLVCERLVEQYLGWLQSTVHMIDSGKFSGNAARIRKTFYHVLHKLWALEELAAGQCPTLRADGELRERILRIRKGPLEGDISEALLTEEVHSRTRAIVVRWCPGCLRVGFGS